MISFKSLMIKNLPNRQGASIIPNLPLHICSGGIDEAQHLSLPPSPRKHILSFATEQLFGCIISFPTHSLHLFPHDFAQHVFTLSYFPCVATPLNREHDSSVSYL